jgi:hypothetical protein
MMTVFRYIPLYQLLIVVVGLIVLLNFVPAYKDRVASLSSLAGGSDAGSTGADHSVRSRSTEMKAAAYVFLDHPIVGVGPGSFPLYYQEYASRVGLDVHEAAQSGSRRGEEARRESHNIFLSIAADLGFLGIVSFLAMLFLTFRRLNRARKRWLRAHPEAANLAASFMLALTAYITSGLFLTLAFERYFWLLLALAGCASALRLEGTAVAEPARERAVAPPVRRPPTRRPRTAAPARRPRIERGPARRPAPVPVDVPVPEQPPPVPVDVPVSEQPPPVHVDIPIPEQPPPVDAPPAPAPAPPAPPSEVPLYVPATVVVDVTLDEAEAGASKLVQVPHVETCPACAGYGAIDDGRCEACDGIGRSVSWSTLTVEVPPDAKDGQRIPLPGHDGSALLCVEPDPQDKIIRYVAYAELAGAIAFIGYLYFVA